MVRGVALFKGIVCLFFCIGTVRSADTAPQLPDHAAKDPRLTYVNTPLSFEPNVGQSDSKSQFLTRWPGFSAQLSPSQAKFEFFSKDRKVSPRSITMDLINGKKENHLQGESLLPGKANYFPGPDKTKWRSNIPTYSRIWESGVYQGIDLAFYGNQKHLEYDFLLHPNADPNQIRMKLSGSDKASIDQVGDLKLSVADQSLTLFKPVIYQLAQDGKTHQPVEGRYQLDQHTNEVGFVLGGYDHSRALVIDPMLSYSEYLDYYASAIAVDSSGNIYVASTPYSGYGNADVTKFSPAGSVVYDTTFGVSYITPNGIAVDSTGKVDVVGSGVCGNDSIPTSSNAYLATCSYGDSAFFIQISADGSSIPYGTYFYGNNSSFANAVAVDSNGNAYVTGNTNSQAAFPTTTGSYQTSNLYTGNYFGYVAEFNPAATTGTASLVYSALLAPATNGGVFYGIALDSSNNAYVTGNFNGNLPVTTGSFQYAGYEATQGAGGVYVTKLNPTGTALVYSAYLGYGTGYGIAVDGKGDAYVSGTVGYSDFPTTSGAYQTIYPGAFVTELNPAGSAEIFSTFLGGPSSFNGNGIVPYSLALTPGCTTCNIYVGGWTNTPDFPVVNAIQSALPSSGSAAFVVELASGGGSALFSSYLGGNNSGINSDDFDLYGKAPALAVDSSGNMSVIGNIQGTPDFPITITNPKSSNSYGFLAKIAPTAAAFNFGLPATINFANEPVGVSTSIAGGTATARLSNYGSAAANISSIQITPGSIFSQTNNCGATLPAGGFCTFDINFTPGSAGSRNGTITVTSNATNSPNAFTLTGTGVDEAYLQPSSASLTFATQTVGTSSTSQAITVTNIGSLSAQPTIGFNGGTDFTQQNGCNTQIAPGANCTISVTFTPTQPGLRQDSLYVSFPGGPTLNVPVSGTGTMTGATSVLTFSTTALAFSPQTVGTLASNAEIVYLTNTGTEPLSIQSIVASGDYSLGSTTCTTPYQLNPQTDCYVYVNFAPTAAGTRTGNLTFTDSATGSPQTVTLTGTGLASSESVLIYPSVAVSFPDQPVGTSGNQQTIYFENTGTSPISVDRVLITGDFYVSSGGCNAVTVAGTTNDGSGSNSYCSVNVNFAPTATGARTGTLTFVDSAPGSPHTVSLSGNGITATGTLALNPNTATFTSQAVGTTSGIQYIYVENPGNTPVNITSEAASGDFSINYANCTPPYSLTTQTYCYVAIQFTPSATGTRTGSFTVQSSAGTFTASLTGTGVTAASTVQLTPSSSMSFGSQVVNTQSSNELVVLQNTGTVPITFSTATALSGANAADFSLGYDYCYNYYSSTGLPPGANCSILVYFTPSAAGSRTATLTFTDSATSATQTVTLTGTGVSTTPTYTLSTNYLTYSPQVQGTTSGLGAYAYFYNNASASVTLANLSVTGNFIVVPGYDSCSGQTISGNGGNCYAYIEYAPPVKSPAGNGVDTGTVTFKNNSSATLISLPLAGYSLAPTYTSYLSPTNLDFTSFQVNGTTSGAQSITLNNTGNTSLTIGTLSGTNLGAAPSSTVEFTLSGDGCSGQPITPGGSCSVNVSFTPNATGAQTGNVSFPVTYSNNATAKLTATLSGTGAAEKNSAVLSPLSGSFPDQAVGTTNNSNYVQAILMNSGNQTFTIGTLTGVNTIVGASTKGEFSTNDACSTAGTIAAGASCTVYVYFTPSATGTRTGSITFPVTFADHTTSNPKLTLSGTGTTAAKTITLSNNTLAFGTEVQSQTTNSQTVTVTNTGNTNISIGTDSITTNSAEFAISSDSCNGNTNLGPNQTCQISITFTPSASASGNQTGVLTIADNASGGPHTVSLTGVAVPASQQIVITPTSLNFGNQPSGTTSSVQVVYITNQGDTTANNYNLTLGGTNAADFQMSFYEGGSPRSTSTAQVTFSPLSTSTGTRTATLTETDSLPGSPRTITLTGNAVTAGPAVGINPTTLTFSSQSVGTTSNSQAFSVKNTGSANLVVSNVSSSNSIEFPLSADGCSGNTLTPGQQCAVSVRFAPTLGGTRTSKISVADNVTGSPQTVPVSGTGTGIPTATPSPGSLTYSNQNIGSTSAAQSVTLQNSGTDTLQISSIALSGANAGDFAISSKTCGTTLAPSGATCTVSVTFTPTAAGSRGASLAITDNANNVSGTTQSVTLAGTGVAVPAATVSPASLTFSSTNIGVASSAQSITVSNSGTGPLTISSVTIGGGSSSGDFSETNNCGATLVAGSSCTISVVFTPSASGARSGTLTGTDNAGNTSGATQTVSLSGTGAGLSGASVSPGSLTFTDQNVGTMSSAQSVTLSNAGTGALTIASIALSGANAADYATTNTCGGSIAAGGSCTISVTFKPGGTGARTGTLTVTDNANNTSGAMQTVALSGTGIGVPAATPSPTSLTFSSQNVGTTSSAQNVTLSNEGTGVLTISGIALSGANAADYATTNTCNGSVAIGGSCTIAVTFSPSAAGTRSAVVTISDNANNTASSQTVSLTGTGAGVAAATVSPASLTFGNQNVGSTGASQTATLTNTGSTALTISSIALSGTNSGDFASSNNCGSSVAVGASCSIAVTLSPTAVGARAATLTITDNASTTQTVSLSGTGVGVAAASVSPNSLPFGTQSVASTSSALTTTLSNSGTAALTITNIAISGTNASSFATTNNCSGSVAAGGSCTISVTFTPSVTGNLSATLTVTDNASNVPGSTQTVALSGTGVGVPVAGVSPSSLSFTQAVGGTSAAQTVTVSNTGTGPLSITSIVIGGTNPSDFAETTTCGSSLAVNATCSISVTFTPATAASFSANLHVIDNSGNTGSTQTVTLSGTGSSTMAPTAGLAPSSLTFPLETTGVTSAAQTLTLSNTGTASLSIASIAVGGTNSSDFAETNNCGTTLAVSAVCSISVTFDPTATGSRSATVIVTDNSGNVSGSTQTSTLSGTGAASATPGLVSLSPNSGSGLSQAFTAVYSDSSGASDLQSLHLNFNTSTSMTNACSVRYSPASNALYLYNNAGTGSSAALSPGSSSSVSNGQCTLYGSGSSAAKSGNNLTVVYNITFSSTFTGTQNAYMSAINNSNAGTGYVLEGTWTPSSAGAPTATLTPASLTFPLQTEGATSTAQTLTLANTGGTTLTIASIVLGGTNPGDFSESNTCGATLAASASCTISVSFDPVATGSRTATVVVTDNSGNVSGSTQSSTLTGTGAATATPGLVSLTPSSGTGITQAFTAVYSDSSGASDLQSLHLTVNTSTSTTNACAVRYSPASNALYLYNNAGTGSSAALTPGSSSSVSNSQCTLNGTGSSATKSGNNLTVVYNITFTSTFTGLQNSYMSAINNVNATTGYVEEGTWTP